MTKRADVRGLFEVPAFLYDTIAAMLYRVRKTQRRCIEIKAHGPKRRQSAKPGSDPARKSSHSLRLRNRLIHRRRINNKTSPSRIMLKSVGNGRIILISLIS